MLVRMRFFHVGELESSTKMKNQYCIAIDKPILTLADIISNVDRKKYLNDHNRMSRYMTKLRKVFWMIGEGIQYLHEQGIIHGHIVAKTCGKFDDGWKLLDLIGSCEIEEQLSSNRFGSSIPPEAVETIANHNGRNNGGKKKRLVEHMSASVSIDIFSFGKLMYEVFTGNKLIQEHNANSHKMVGKVNGQIDDNNNHQHDLESIEVLGNWDEENLSVVVSEIECSGVGTLAADLISHCLCPHAQSRPKSMNEVLAHPYWSSNDVVGLLHKHRGGSDKRKVKNRNF